MPAAAGNLALSLFASALAGKPVPLEFTQSTVGGSDGSTIFVPTQLDQHCVEARHLVICQASLQRSGTYRKDVLRKLNRGGSDIARRYLTLEVLRSCAVIEQMLPRSFVAALHDAGAGIPASATPTESLSRARSTERLPSPPPWFGELVPSRILSAGNASAADDSAGNELTDPASLPEPDEDEDDDAASGDRSRIMELFSAPLRSPFGEALQKLLGMGRSPGDGTAGDEVPIVGARRGRGHSTKGRLAPGTEPRVEMAGELVVGAAYPEWDTHRRSYREEWTLVGEFDPAPADDVEPTGAQPNRPLVRSLARLGLAWETHRAEPMGDNLDLSALVDLHTSVAAGHGCEALVYTAARRTSQRLGVLILLDATGSTAETADGETVFAAQRNLAFEVTSALDQLGVRTATYGFYSQGRRNVRFLHAKSFEEQWSAAAQRRLLSISPSGFTRLGAAIRHATNIVATRAGTDHQLVVVIGDGVVFDHGYEGRYACEDSRFAVEEATLRGVAIAGLSVCPTPDDSIWPLTQHRVVRDAAELAPHVRDLFGGALGRVRGVQRPHHPRRSVYVSAGI
ncbi:von Willebrand factor type A [Mycolicibacterium rhodesiae JS60]|nr:von Willebrand factor type A [Mycolicibacterium rhodesiae JS60]